MYVQDEMVLAAVISCVRLLLSRFSNKSLWMMCLWEIPSSLVFLRVERYIWDLLCWLWTSCWLSFTHYHQRTSSDGVPPYTIGCVLIVRNSSKPRLLQFLSVNLLTNRQAPYISDSHIFFALVLIRKHHWQTIKVYGVITKMLLK